MVSVAASTVILLAAGPPATQAQTGEPIRVAEQKKAAPQEERRAPKKDAKEGRRQERRAKSSPTPAAYAGMPIAERAAIQFDLNWTSHYSGQADGDFNDRSVAAVKAFQKDRGFRETGVLTDSEREALATSAKNRRERVGWRMVEDRATGAQVGLPTKLATHESRDPQRHALAVGAGPVADRDLPHPRAGRDARHRVRGPEEGAAQPPDRLQRAARRHLRADRHAGAEVLPRARGGPRPRDPRHHRALRPGDRRHHRLCRARRC